MDIAVSVDLEVEQLDVKITFLHEDLEEEIYVQQPEGFVEKGKENLLCRVKSLYGLKQALWQWYRMFESFISNQGCHKTQVDHCIFVKKHNGQDFLVLLL